MNANAAQKEPSQGEKRTISIELDIERDVAAIMSEIHEAAKDDYAKFEDLNAKLQSSLTLQEELGQRIRDLEERDRSILQVIGDMVMRNVLDEKKKIKMEAESARELLQDLSDRTIPTLKAGIEEARRSIYAMAAHILMKHKPVRQGEMKELVKGVEALYAFWQEVVNKVLAQAEVRQLTNLTDLLNLRELEINAPRDYFEKQSDLSWRFSAMGQA